jgi:uncharacterized membrane protein YhaH (DUF805 family)
MGSIDFNKLWQNFLDTVTNHYADFNGRVGRPQFWYYMLVAGVILLGVHIVANLLWIHLLSFLALLALLLPNAGMAMRRLQDTGRSGTLVWGALIPLAVIFAVTILSLIGGLLGIMFLLGFLFTFGIVLYLIALGFGIAVLYFCAQPGMTEANQYGPVPPVFDPTMATPAAPTPPPATPAA